MNGRYKIIEKKVFFVDGDESAWKYFLLHLVVVKESR
jgi:hypothetical protein